jgi:hypothetical protein
MERNTSEGCQSDELSAAHGIDTKPHQPTEYDQSQVIKGTVQVNAIISASFSDRIRHRKQANRGMT